MAISLKKGQAISLKKSENSLSQVTIGLGWDMAKKNNGLFGKIFGKKDNEAEYDLDVVAFLLNDKGRVASLGDKLVGGDVVFFNSMVHGSGNIWLTGDNRTGEGDGDDEQIVINLEKLDARYQRIVFVVQIYNGKELNQDFGAVDNAFIRAVDARYKEMARYDITARSECAGMRSLKFAELYREQGEWRFKAIGQPYKTSSFVDILQEYVD